MKYLIIIICLIPSIILGGTLDMSFYGDTQRWWIGTVEEGSAQSDPTGLGRCRVRIDGIHGPDISLNDLPYAQTILPPTGGGTSGIGDTPQLLPGSRVTGFFLDGAASQIPAIYGYMPQIGIPTITQQEIIAKTSPVVIQKINKDEFTHYANHSTNVDVASDDITRMWKFFESLRIYKKHHIAAIIGNAIKESGSWAEVEGSIPTVSPSIVSQISGEDSQGLMQWNPKGRGKRLQKLKAFAATRNKPFTDLYIQLKFIHHELTNAAGDSTGLAANFFETKDTLEATMTFMRYYLRPSFCVKSILVTKLDKNGDPVLNKAGQKVKVPKCIEFYPDRHGLTFFTDRYTVAEGGRFPANGRGRVRIGEESRIRFALRIYTLYYQGKVTDDPIGNSGVVT